ncbi:MAG: hypothetical protein IPK26_14465 [Planctomycetes bacterium]|nr:hypothetical protein [Planctomycetota bacterium]
MDADPREQRLHELLDQRIDPLTDPTIVDWFSADPTAVERYARLHERLPALRALPVRRSPRLVPRFAIAAVLFATTWLCWPEPAAGARPTPHAQGSLVVLPPTRPMTFRVRTALFEHPDARLEVFTERSLPR